MTLPEIPEEARAAGKRGFIEGHPLRAEPVGSGYSTTQGQVDAILAAAWPHAGATWLRWAADEIEYAPPGTVVSVCRALRRLADEVAASGSRAQAPTSPQPEAATGSLADEAERP